MFLGLICRILFLERWWNTEYRKTHFTRFLQSFLERVPGMGVSIANAEVKLRFIALLVCLIIFSNFSMLVQEMFFLYFYSVFLLLLLLRSDSVCLTWLYMHTYIYTSTGWPKYSFVRNAMFKVIHNFVLPKTWMLNFRFIFVCSRSFEWVIC